MSLGFFAGGALAVDGTRRFAGMTAGAIRIGVWLGLTLGPAALVVFAVIGGIKTGYWWLAPIPMLALVATIRAIFARRWWRAGGLYLLTGGLGLAVAYPMLMSLEAQREARAVLDGRAWTVARMGYLEETALPAEIQAWKRGLVVQEMSSVPKGLEGAYVAQRAGEHAGVEHVGIAPLAAFMEYEALAARHGDWLGLYRACGVGAPGTPTCRDDAARKEEFGIDIAAHLQQLSARAGLACGDFPACDTLRRMTR